MAVPDDPAAISMYTAHRLDDAGKHLGHASERLGAARDASGALRQYHLGHCAHHLDGAHLSALQLAGNIKAHYPAEGSELRALTATIGLARAVSPAAKTATTSHLVQTVCNHLGHTLRHVQAMQDDPDPAVWMFNHAHATTHLSGAAEHVGKLRAHLADNYGMEDRWLAGLEDVTSGDSRPPMTAQMAAATATELAERAAALELAVDELRADPRVARALNAAREDLGLSTAEVAMELRASMGLEARSATEYEASMPPVGDLAHMIGVKR